MYIDISFALIHGLKDSAIVARYQLGGAAHLGDNNFLYQVCNCLSSGPGGCANVDVFGSGCCGADCKRGGSQ